MNAEGIAGAPALSRAWKQHWEWESHTERYWYHGATSPVLHSLLLGFILLRQEYFSTLFGHYFFRSLTRAPFTDFWAISWFRDIKSHRYENGTHLREVKRSYQKACRALSGSSPSLLSTTTTTTTVNFCFLFKNTFQKKSEKERQWNINRSTQGCVVIPGF